MRVDQTVDVQTLAPGDYQRARKALGRAFHEYNLMVYAAADSRRRLRGTTTVYGAIMGDCFRRGEVYVTDDCAGVASWLPPGVSVPGLWHQIRSGMLAMPLHFGRQGFFRLVDYDNVARRLHHEHAPMPHWYLAAIGVQPEWQGQGIGNALLRPMLARADTAGIACYLDTHLPENVRLYERHGFHVAERVDLPNHPIPVWAMLRHPRPAAG